MKTLGLIFRLAAIVFGILVTIAASNNLVIFGCVILDIEMIIVCIHKYVHTLPKKLVALVIDIALTIPTLCFILYFLSINDMQIAFVMFILNIIGMFKAYNLYKFK